MRQLSLFNHNSKFLTLKEANEWASQYMAKNIDKSNIMYLIKYGRIKNYGNDRKILIDVKELKEYYDNIKRNEEKWKKKLGDDLNWALSFSQYKESERTKHVHRLHPYKGKFIPQLVEYFLDDHIDEFKQDVFFNKGNIVLDPFCGSGTTLVQANELGIHAVGIDISYFNVMLSNVKVSKYNFLELNEIIYEISADLAAFIKDRKNILFENELNEELNRFNSLYFPSPDYRVKVDRGEIDEFSYSKEKEKKILEIYRNLIDKYQIKIIQENRDTFLGKWLLYPVREEVDFLLDRINKVKDRDLRQVLMIILSRTVRSCRATTHADLATLKTPVTSPYYCKKHSKICKPVFSVKKWWDRYSKDTINRLLEFDKIRTDTFQVCISGDSRKVDIVESVGEINPAFAKIIENNKIDGIFPSPPYVGMIDYHEQHAYAYELFNIERKDEEEIGPLYKGQGKEARESYIKGIADVLNNCKRFLKRDYNIFLIANDKYNLYPKIVELAGMKIVNKYKRPVLNRVEKDRTAYAEIIFHIKEA